MEESGSVDWVWDVSVDSVVGACYVAVFVLSCDVCGSWVCSGFVSCWVSAGLVSES